MDKSRIFGNLRRRLAPMIRPVLEHCPPVRAVAVRLLRFKQGKRITRCGLEFILPSGDFGVTLELESTGEYEPVTTSLLDSHISEGMTFVDVGAHVGLFSLQAAVLVGDQGKVISFEPHPENYAMLVENMTHNHLQDRIVPVNSAVSNVAHEMELHISSYNSGDHHLFHKGGRRTVKVACTTLDTYFPIGTRVDFIKMDIQGAEAYAFYGMKRVIEENREIQIVWELSPSLLKDAGTNAEDLMRWLAEFDFNFTIVDDASGTMQKASVDEILQTCPFEAYVNILCARQAP